MTDADINKCCRRSAGHYNLRMKWKTLSKEEIFRIAFISLDKEVCELPDGRRMPGYYVLHFPDWVNVTAIDKNGDILMIKQYRHASKRIHWEIPGGAVDKNEDPALSAARELRETGMARAPYSLSAPTIPTPRSRTTGLTPTWRSTAFLRERRIWILMRRSKSSSLTRRSGAHAVIRRRDHTICVCPL